MKRIFINSLFSIFISMLSLQIFAQTDVIVDGIIYQLRSYRPGDMFWGFCIGPAEGFKGEATIYSVIKYGTPGYEDSYGINSVGGFSNCSGLTAVTIPLSLTIDAYAFENCTNLSKITWVSDVSENGYGTPFPGNSGQFAFAGCTGLTSVTIPNVPSLAYGLFSNCTNLKDVIFTEGIKGLSGFDGCTSLEQISLPNSIESIGSDCFANTSLKEITIPKSVIDIGAHAFKDCKQLKKIVFEDDASEIKLHEWFSDGTPSMPPFAGCDNIEYIYYGRYLSYRWLFEGHTSLKTLEVGDSVKSFGDFITFSFNGCTNLETVILPKTLENLNSSFYGCNSLKNIYCYMVDPTKITYSSWSYNDVIETCTVNVPEGSRPLYGKTPYWNSFKFIKEMGVEPIREINQLRNDKAYKLEPEDAKCGVFYGNPNSNYLDICGGAEGYNNADIQVNRSDENQQFILYKYDDKYYIYNVGLKKFVSGYENFGDNVRFTFSDTPVCSVTLTASSVSDEFVISIDDNVFMSATEGINGCVGKNEEDGGNRLSIFEVADISEELQRDILEKIIVAAGIEDYQINTDKETYYDLQGRRVNNPTKGVYILNGNKIIK